ncbi:MAG: hypothetical protein UDB11_03465 [Peptococcaceae bacterium]|nr:hypothetical protein [Peptococcaceae bacterium]
MSTRFMSVFLCIIGLTGILFIVSGSHLLGWPMTIIGFLASFSLIKK